MAVIWGVPYLLIKIAVAELSPATLVLIRTVIGATILVPLAVFRGGIGTLAPHWRAVLVYTFVEVAAPWFFLSDAERRLSSSLSGLLIAGVPLVGALLAWLFAGDDRPDARRLGGLVLGFAGVAVLVGLDVSTDDLGAVVEVGLVVVGYAIGPMIVARQLREIPAVAVIAASLVITAIAHAPVGVAQLPAHLPSSQAILAVVLLGVVCTAIAFVLFFELIAEVGPNRATVITYFNPAVALALGVALLGEPLTLGIAVGFALIAFGSFVATRRARPAAAVQSAARALPPSAP
jgi:drug/metabolite transporter (DMT)-like permease